MQWSTWYEKPKFKSFGFLEFHESGWVVLRCCPELPKYYRQFIRAKGLGPSPYNSHITVVNGGAEAPLNTFREGDEQRHCEALNLQRWGKREGEKVEFEYTGEVKSKDGYYWLPVKCEALFDLREELGLSRWLQWPLHLTIAKEKWG